MILALTMADECRKTAWYGEGNMPIGNPSYGLARRLTHSAKISELRWSAMDASLLVGCVVCLDILSG